MDRLKFCRLPVVLLCGAVLLCAPGANSVQPDREPSRDVTELSIPPDLSSGAGRIDEGMVELARAVIARAVAGHKPDAGDLFRAQLAAGADRDALDSLEKLRAPLRGDTSPRVRARYLEYVTYARAALTAHDRNVPFEDAYRDTFRALIETLDDRTSAIVVNSLSFDNLAPAKQALDGDLARLKGHSTVSLEDAIQLIHDEGDVRVYSALAPGTAALIAEDDARRYLVEKDIAVPTPDGAVVCAVVVRPRAAARLPALLEFTIYNDPGAVLREARRTASNGYAGLVGLTRGKGCSPGPIVPYEHDGADSDTLIHWIAAQPWSDGRVGMYGGSYSGFTPWAALKHRPQALKAIMVGAPNAPGLDAPMEGNVFWNFIYPWPFYTTDNKTLDNATYGDAARWNRLSRNWYVSGRAYRDLEKIDGTPNPIFDRWLDHPSYDAYWRSLIPHQKDLAKTDIPVLVTAGYYFGGPGAATYYFGEYQKYSPRAESYLIIGPYDHFIAQRGTANSQGNIDLIAGYKLDPAALIDLVELRYRWFDFVLKGGARPAILADRVNYEVTGADVWKHAPSLAGMAAGSLTFHLSAARSGDTYRLVKPANGTRIVQTVSFADRGDVDRQAPGGGVEDKDLDTTNGLVFVSDPFPRATELSGLFSGRLDFITNKKDFDFQIALYELTRAGHYIQLAPYWSRASFVADLSRRGLLVPGKRQSLAFHSSRLMSRLLAPGSRLVAVLSVIKEPGREINYGTGGTVADETIGDAKIPLEIRWLGSSFLTVPLGR